MTTTIVTEEDFFGLFEKFPGNFWEVNEGKVSICVEILVELTNTVLLICHESGLSLESFCKLNSTNRKFCRKDQNDINSLTFICKRKFAILAMFQ